MTDTKRDAFEAWARDTGINITRCAIDTEEFAFPVARASWRAWQAAAPAQSCGDAEQADDAVKRLRRALYQIAHWPDGGNAYGQEKIKRFAIGILDGDPVVGGEGQVDEAVTRDAERWRKFAEDGAPEALAAVVSYQEVKRIENPGPTPCFGWDDSNHAEARVIYEQQAIREIRIRWVDADGSEPTLLHMIDAAIDDARAKDSK